MTAIKALSRFKFMMRFIRVLALGIVTCLPLSIQAGPGESTLNLGQYTLTDTILLPPGDFSVNPSIINAHEVSAITYNWDTNTLFVVGDEGGAILEVGFDGSKLSQMAIIGFNDPEGLSYIGNGEFVIVEERNRDVYKLTYTEGSFVLKSSLNGIDLGAFVNNIGIEGISYDPISDEYITVKEKSPQEVNINTLNFSTQTALINPLFTPDLGVTDIADVYVIRTLPEAQAELYAEHLLIISQESQLILEVDRSGNVLSQFSLNGIASTAEGVTMGPDGTIYFTAENGDAPQMFILSPPAVEPPVRKSVPMPLWAFIMLAGLLSLSGLMIKKKLI